MKHFVNNRELFEQYPEGMSEIILGAGCFWGVERVFWKLEGVWVTYASYSGGRRVNPNYEQICTGVTGHAETVNVIFDKNIISLNEILKTFWECHDPTQGMRQGNDIGEQYRSVIYCNNDEDLKEKVIVVTVGFRGVYNEIKKFLRNLAKFLYHKFIGTCNNVFGIAFGVTPNFQKKGLEDRATPNIQIFTVSHSYYF